jgi:hypothetical protein
VEDPPPPPPPPQPPPAKGQTGKVTSAAIERELSDEVKNEGESHTSDPVMGEYMAGPPISDPRSEGIREIERMNEQCCIQ